MPDKETISTIMNTYGITPDAAGGGGFNWGNILLGVFFGIIGLYAFNYGRKEKNFRPLTIGIVLMGFPYFVSNTWLMALIGCALTAAIFIWKE